MKLYHQENTLKQVISELSVVEIPLIHRKQIRKRGIVLPFLLLINGCSMGFLLGNHYLIPVLGVGFFSIPFAVKKKEKLMDLKPSITAITKAYISNGDIKQAIENCLPTVPEQYQIHFSHFLELSVQDGIAYLKTQITHQYFQEWCDRLQLCQVEFSLHPLLLEVLHRQTEIDIAMTAFTEKMKFIRILYFLLCFLVHLPLAFL